MIRSVRLQHRLALCCLFPLAAASVALASGNEAGTNEASREARRNGVINPSEYIAHIRYLASDDLMGRDVGTPGIESAAKYIAEQFRNAGLEPGGLNGTYFQEFDLGMWRKLGDGNSMTMKNGDKERAFKLGRDFTPMSWAKSGEFDGEIVYVGYGIASDSDKYNDYDGVDVDGKIALMFRYEPKFLKPNPKDPNSHSAHAPFQRKARRALDRGAIGVIIVDPVTDGETKDELMEFSRSGQGHFGLPMLQMTRKAASALLKAGGLTDVETLQNEIETTKKSHSRPLDGATLSGKVDVQSDGPMVKNVIGLKPGVGPDKDQYIVIGGHFDHLGKSISQWTGRGPEAIHNGADDNASGTSAVIESAKLIGHGPQMNRSMLFMAFTAEEKGLLGSRHFVDNPTVPLENIVAMLNMDMVGRMRENSVQVGGMETGKGLKDIVMRLAADYGCKIIDGGGGVGPSDHASFFTKGIPVLFMFTGMHGQYHRPEDDIELINAEGAARIAQIVCDVAYEVAAADERPEYKRDMTPENLWNPDSPADVRSSGGNRPPRLGVMIGEDGGEGVLVDGVTGDSLAEKAGIKSGDRILRIGARQIKDRSDLRTALRRTEPGESVEVEVQRGDEKLKLTLQFPGGDKADDKPEEPAAPAPRRPTDNGDDAAPPAMPSVRLGIAPSYQPGKEGEGFLIEAVSADGPAEKAGLKSGDHILKIGKSKIWDIRSYMEALSPYKPGDEIVLTVQRDGKELEIKLIADAGGRRDPK